MQLEEDKRLAALRSVGLSRKEEESMIQLGSLFQQRKLLEGKSSVKQQKIDVRIAQIDQELDKVEVDAAFQRWQDSVELQISHLKNEKVLADSDGRFVDSGNLRNQIIALSDQLADARTLGEIPHPSK